ncbi:MAG: hypothetical protein HY231_08920 [Acidobacteria bacterium]|nr:hypothetical protein [Acidobacteriota bacterium]
MDSLIKLNDFARRVMWRARWLALQDALAWSLGAGGFIAAALIFYIRWQAIQTPVWLVALVVFAALFGAFITRWSINRTNSTDAGFLIDEQLNLEDRFASSQAIFGHSDAPNEVAQALLEDAVERIETVKPATILPYRWRGYYALSLLALLALSVAVLLPQKTLPGGAEMIQAQADIQAAGEVLEQTSTEIEKFAPPDTVTANLAKEQTELGRSLRRSTDSRAEALKKLSSLEDRIRQRQDELKSTRADDIVALAQRRLGATLAQMGKPNNQAAGDQKAQASNEDSSTTAASQDQSANPKSSATQPSSDNAGKPSSGEKVAKASEKKSGSVAERKARATSIARKAQASSKASINPVAKQNPNEEKSKPDAANNVTAQTNQGAAANQPPAKNAAESQPTNSQKSAKTTSPDNSISAKEQTAEKTQPSAKDQSQNSGQPNPSENAVAQNQTTNNKPTDQPENEQAKQQENEQATPANQGQPKNDATNPFATAVAEQTAKALPQLSEQLLKKAEELRDGKLSAEDIKRLALSAGQLAKDLAPIAQSKEFQKSLEELAKQVNPKQLEEVARALMQDEKLQRELQAAAKLLMENRQVKDMVAGLTKTGAEIANDFRKQGGEEIGKVNPDASPMPSPSEPLKLGSNRKSNEKGQQNGQSLQGTNTARREAQRKLAGQGRAATISGQLQNRPGGDYVFSGVKPDAGAARVPYSTAYPQYRRQAERTVERSQVPTQMRSMIRNYFDAINPNGKN